MCGHRDCLFEKTRCFARHINIGRKFTTCQKWVPTRSRNKSDTFTLIGKIISVHSSTCRATASNLNFIPPDCGLKTRQQMCSRIETYLWLNATLSLNQRGELCVLKSRQEADACCIKNSASENFNINIVLTWSKYNYPSDTLVERSIVAISDLTVRISSSIVKSLCSNYVQSIVPTAYMLSGRGKWHLVFWLHSWLTFQNCSGLRDVPFKLGTAEIEWYDYGVSTRNNNLNLELATRHSCSSSTLLGRKLRNNADFDHNQYRIFPTIFRPPSVISIMTHSGAWSRRASQLRNQSFIILFLLRCTVDSDWRKRRGSLLKLSL